jgi:hypothetical protein
MKNQEDFFRAYKPPIGWDSVRVFPNEEELHRAYYGDYYEEWKDYTHRMKTNIPKSTQDFLRWLRGPYGGGSVERAHNVLRWAHALPDEEGVAFWEVVVEEWSGFDLIPHEEFSVQFLRFSRCAPRCDAQGSITLYRGQDRFGALGLSWTLCKETAAQFARGHRGIKNEAPVILCTTTTAERVAFTCHDREESEYVLFQPPTDVIMDTCL